jgi:hypothetical protein
MIQYNKSTINLIETVLDIAINSMPKNQKELKAQIKNKSGIFELLPTDPKEIAEMIAIYNLHKYPSPTWVTQYVVRDSHNKHGTSIGKFVEDGRIRTKIEGEKTYYAEEDVKMFAKFDLLFSLAETRNLVTNYTQPQLDLSLYLRYNMKEKGKDLDIGKLQVMNMLLNEFMEIAIYNPETRQKLQELLKDTK